VDPTIVAIICFFAIAAIVIAVSLLVRDLVFSGQSETSVSLVQRSRMLRRAAKATESDAKSISDQIDRGFDRLVLESGVDYSSLTAALLCIVSGLMAGGLVLITLDHPAAAALVGAFALPMPLFYLMFKRKKRLTTFRTEIPQLLDLLARSARAGRSLEQSLELASVEMSGDLGKELDTCVKQLKVGRSFAAVMKSLASRVRLLEVRILATTLIVQRGAGGNLPETLDRMSSVVRDRLFAVKKARATTAAGKTSAMLITAICPIAYLTMFILQPEHMSVLLTDPLGQMLLTAAVVMELVGMAWVAMLLKQEG